MPLRVMIVLLLLLGPSGALAKTPGLTTFRVFDASKGKLVSFVGYLVPTSKVNRLPVRLPHGLGETGNLPRRLPHGLGATGNLPRSLPHGLGRIGNLPQRLPHGLGQSGNLPKRLPHGLGGLGQLPAQLR